MLRIGVNALYLIPGGVGGTEIYLRNLLAALAEIDSVNQYIVFTNRETGADLVPGSPEFRDMRRRRSARRFVRRAFCGSNWFCRSRCAGIGLDVLFNPGIHCAASVRLPDGHGVSRSAAQAASGIFSLVRSAVLEFLSMGVGAAVARIDRGVRCDARRFAALLRGRALGDSSRRGARVL